MRTSKRRTVRIVSFFLVLAMLLSLVPINVFSTFGGDEPIITDTGSAVVEDHARLSILHEGAEKSSIMLERDNEEVLTAFTADIVPDGRTWQILIPGSNTWVNIDGQNREELKVSYSLVGSMLDKNGKAYVRTTATKDGHQYFSDSTEIVMSYSTDEDINGNISEPLMASRASTPAVIAEEETETFTIVINYIFDNGGIAFESYGASVAKGSDFNKAVTSPTVVGYEPFRRVDNEYVDASVVELNYTNITENITVNVIYEPAIVDYQIHHHLQDLYDDEYSLHADYITYGKGLTGSTVPSGLAMSENELPGFTPLAYEKLTVAADGSTVIEIRYNRNYYLVNFDMNGGYGVEPVYVRYGSKVGANVPVRHGYIFEGWELVSYGGEEPTSEQASMYDINSATINVPSANLTYRARWTTQLVNYTMVFWKENIDDNGFTYWGSLNGLTAMSGDIVDGSDRISEVGGIDDESAFTYSDALTDKDVIVEGDGSTVVNVYYTRNRYTITFKAKGKCVIPTGHTHTDDCYTLLCNKSHIHTDDCDPVLNCDIPVHEAHDESCVICGKTEHTHSSVCCGYEEHTHTTACYNYIGNASTPSGAPTGVENGYIFAARSGWRYYYYIYINGVWYRYNGTGASSGDVINSKCGKTEHTHGTTDCACQLTPHVHTSSCYKDSLHVHDVDKCYTYSCDLGQHIHTEGCSVLDCPIPVGHTHNSTCNSSSATNTVKLVYKKYEENLEDIWPITDDNGKTYNEGQRWSPTNSDTYSAVLVYIANMPAEDFTLTLNESNYDTFTMNYYLEVLGGEASDVTYGGKNFKLYTTVKANYNYLTEKEDFFDIHGFYQFASNPAFSNGQIDINGGGVVNFYYGRLVDHHLEFNNEGTVISNKTQSNLPYGESLKDFNFVPDYPSSLEPGAFVFDGWYTTPGLYPGTEVNWDTLTMTAGDIMLYAKWAPITHSVNVYLDSSMTDKIGSTQLVNHGSFADAPTQTVENGNYIFQGWFYLDTENGETVEKAFVFTGIPVLQDMDIYAKWSSHVTVNYTINYVLKLTGEPIADPTVGSGIAGHNKTFYAKTGVDLYDGFTEGYYPMTSSHTVTMSAESDHEFTFEYVYVESVPYMVRYLDENGNTIIEDKKVLDNKYSVVTETFIKVNGMMPDAYQKRLVLSASGTDADSDGILDNNVIIFKYSSDSVHAYYRVVHYIEQISDSGYREYRSEDAVGTIGESYTVTPITMNGFSFNGQKTTVNGVLSPTSDGSVTATLTSEGLLIELYYDRVDVGYTVKYLENGTNKVLYTEKIGAGIFGEQVVEYAPGLTHIGYTLVSDSVKSIHLAANESLNVIEFYYQEITYSLKYQIVGSTDGATLSMTSENILAVNGVPSGSTPYINSGYHFVGWYLDEACTRPVPIEWIDGATNHLTPESDGVWLASHVYYAKVDPDFVSLTVSTIGCADVDDGQIFIFNIVGLAGATRNINLTVTVIGNSSVTINELPIGNYTVTELTDWSYRYTPDAVSKSIGLTVTGANSLTFSHIRTNTKWLDSNASNENVYD